VDLKFLGDYYVSHRQQVVEKIRDYLENTHGLVARNGLTVRGVPRLQNLFNRIFDAQNAPPGLLASDLCIPVPGAPC